MSLTVSPIHLMGWLCLYFINCIHTSELLSWVFPQTTKHGRLNIPNSFQFIVFPENTWEATQQQVDLLTLSCPNGDREKWPSPCSETTQHGKGKGTGITWYPWDTRYGQYMCSHTHLKKAVLEKSLSSWNTLNFEVHTISAKGSCLSPKPQWWR